MKANEIKKGTTVFVKLIGNVALRKSEDQLIEQWEITKTGRKYLYAKKPGSAFATCFEFVERYYNVEHGCWVEKTDYSSNYILYFSEQEAKDEMLRSKLIQKISDLTNSRLSILSLEQLKEINSIFESALEKNRTL